MVVNRSHPQLVTANQGGARERYDVTGIPPSETCNKPIPKPKPDLGKCCAVLYNTWINPKT